MLGAMSARSQLVLTRAAEARAKLTSAWKLLAESARLQTGRLFVIIFLLACVLNALLTELLGLLAAPWLRIMIIFTLALILGLCFLYFFARSRRRTNKQKGATRSANEESLPLLTIASSSSPSCASSPAASSQASSTTSSSPVYVFPSPTTRRDRFPV